MNTGKLIVKRSRGFDLSPVQIEVDKKKFHIEWGETIEMNLPIGNYTVLAHGLFGCKGSSQIEISEDTPTSIVLTQVLPNEVSIIGISILLLSLVLSYIGLISTLLFGWALTTYSILSMLYFIIKRKKYFQFEKRN